MARPESSRDPVTPIYLYRVKVEGRPLRPAAGWMRLGPGTGGPTTMNRSRWHFSMLAAVPAFLLCSFLASLIPRTAAGQRQEITRLAELMQWKAGTIVADIGAGDGSYSFAAAEIVGNSGRVYATEIEPGKLKQL